MIAGEAISGCRPQYMVWNEVAPSVNQHSLEMFTNGPSFLSYPFDKDPSKAFLDDLDITAKWRNHPNCTLYTRFKEAYRIFDYDVGQFPKGLIMVSVHHCRGSETFV